MTRPPAIAIIDDDASVCKVLERLFRSEGFQVAIAVDGKQAMELVASLRPDIIILDLDMPGISGQEVCRRIRGDSAFDTTSILVLTGRIMDGQSARCLNDGADDYVEKPLDNNELVARVRAILRRPRIMTPMNGVIARGSLVVELAARKVAIDGVAVALAPKEFDLLAQLVLHSPRAIDRNTLAMKVWGVTLDLLNGRTIDVHIRRIRKKLGHCAGSLKTVQTIGFQWDDSSAADTGSGVAA